MRACPSDASERKFIITPIRRTALGCCARATNGDATAPPTSVMNSRRLIFGPVDAALN
jgi:hypothetical protein